MRGYRKHEFVRAIAGAWGRVAEGDGTIGQEGVRGGMAGASDRPESSEQSTAFRGKRAVRSPQDRGLACKSLSSYLF